jgi:hypothetical protein
MLFGLGGMDVLVLGRPWIHVDVEASGRHLVADRKLNPHGQGVSLLES